MRKNYKRLEPTTPPPLLPDGVLEGLQGMVQGVSVCLYDDQWVHALLQVLLRHRQHLPRQDDHTGGAVTNLHQEEAG